MANIDETPEVVQAKAPVVSAKVETPEVSQAKAPAPAPAKISAHEYKYLKTGEIFKQVKPTNPAKPMKLVSETSVWEGTSLEFKVAFDLVD